MSATAVQLGGSATVSLVDYVQAFVINGTADSQIDWTVTSTGSATVSVEGQSGLTFSTDLDARSITLNSGGSGAATVTVAAT